MPNSSEDKPKSRLIETRELKNIRPVFSGSGEVVRLYDQFKKIFEKTKEHQLFAEPVIAEGQRHFISWYTVLEGEIRSYHDLDEKEKEKIKGRLKNQVDRLRHMAGEHIKNETFKRALDDSLEVPTLENSVFIVGDRVVLVEWGMIKDEFKPRRGIIKNLIADEPPGMKTAAMKLQTIYPGGEPAPGVPLNLRYLDNEIQAETDSDGYVRLKDIPLDTMVNVKVKQQRQEDIDKGFICIEQDQYPPIVVEDMREREVILPPPPPPTSTPPPEPGPGKEKETKKRGLWWLWLLLSILILAALFALLRNCHCGKEPVPPIVGTPSVPLKNIAIIVRDTNTGLPIESAGVTVRYNGKKIDKQTNEQGAAEFRDIPANDELNVFVKAEGYEEKSEKIPCCTDREYRLKPLVLRGQTGELRINLRWYNCADLDLYVRPPCGPEIYFGNLRSKCRGEEGRMDIDTNRSCGANINCLDPQENVYWQKAPAGKYVIFVELFDPCGISGEIDFTVRTEIKGQEKDYPPGKVTVKKEKVTVTEFTIEED